MITPEVLNDFNLDVTHNKKRLLNYPKFMHILFGWYFFVHIYFYYLLIIPYFSLLQLVPIAKETQINLLKQILETV